MVISLSYIYLLNGVVRQHFLRHLTRGLDRAILVMDEAHKVPDIALEIASDGLCLP